MTGGEDCGCLAGSTSSNTGVDKALIGGYMYNDTIVNNVVVKF
jgi:hypothetical protein